ncbi:hypothetical protein Tco_1478481 [Tanacetum coccineum]
MKDNLLMIVDEGIRLEMEKTKDDIASMVADAVRKEQERIRVELYVQVSNDVATNIPSQVDAFLRNYMKNNILHVHPTKFASSYIPGLQQQLYLKMKDDEQARNVNLPIWIALMHKYDHKDHLDDDARPEGESSAKDKEHPSIQEDFDPWSDDQGTNDDEVPSEEV